MNNYTGRQIAIFTDAHGLLVPTRAILEDIKNRGIKEVYSLGDNLGVGPNPAGVLDLLCENNVVSLNGNSEEYSILGIEPFLSYFTDEKKRSQEWTYNQLSSKHLKWLETNKHSIDLNLGEKLVGLCHFANDVRIDFTNRSTWSYQNAIEFKLENPQTQFYYTNSLEQKQIVKLLGRGQNSRDKGYNSYQIDPLFNGKEVTCYDEIIQGHVHYNLFTQDENFSVRTIRAVGMGYRKPEDCDYASYIIIKEKEKGYDVDEVLVPYDRNLMEKYISKSNMPVKDPILKFTKKL